MQSKPALRIIGTLLFLLGIFGYLFPQWRGTLFTNNENLFHVVTGLVAILLSHGSVKTARWTLLIEALLYLALGVYGFSLKHPGDFHIKHVTAQLDMVDNGIHVVTALALSWLWLNSRRG